jgi:hypothetical protein
MLAFKASIALAVLVTACSEYERLDNEGAARLAAEQEMLSDPLRASAEFDRRLRSQVSVRGGLIIVRNAPIENSVTYILPASAPWVISCGYGFIIHFGTAIDGTEGYTSNLVQLDLAHGLEIPPSTCNELGPLVGETLLSMLRIN